MLRITVLGNPDRYLAPLAGGTGYLLEGGGARILLDCGPGVRTALANGLDAASIDAVVLSHFHYDHVLDLVAVAPALAKGTPLILPTGSRGNLAAIARAFAFTGAFEPPGPLIEARPGETHAFKKLRLDFMATQHSAPAIATRARLLGRTLVYASDTAPCLGLFELARRADLVLAHALLPTVDAGSEHARIHSTAETAGRLAHEAGARRLVLSHRHWESKDDEMRSAAARAHGDVVLAAPGATYGTE